MQYFDHATDAATDPKIMQLRLECGGSAVDAYWYLVEQMHRDERSLCVRNASVMRVHCHTLNTDEKTFETWVSAMLEIGLLAYSEDGESVVSNRAMENVERYQAKQEKASSAAKSRWGNADAKQTHKRTQYKRNADAMPTKQNKTKDSNAINGITNPAQSGVAAAASAAPPARAVCPMCEVPLWRNTQTGRYHCDACHDNWEEGKVRWA